ncbi:hypothetical protein IAU59_006182 [Kwoniella sp. CBS 9459]
MSSGRAIKSKIKLTTKTKTLLVTVGSTLFPSLTDAILSAPIPEIIASSGITKLVVQYGRADLPSRDDIAWKQLGITLDGTGQGTGSFSRLQDAGDGEGLKAGAVGGDGGGGGDGGSYARAQAEVEVQVFRFTDDFEGLVKSSDYVISHAGSGSILTTLRTKNHRDQAIPLMIVPNESLMDNHQAELADKMGVEGYLFVSRVEELSKSLPAFLDDESPERRSIKPFPGLNKTAFKDIVDETMGYI